MQATATLTGEDRVIIVCVVVLAVITVAALVAIILVPASTNSIIPIMAGTVIAISSLAARHPPTNGTVVQPGTIVSTTPGSTTTTTPGQTVTAPGQTSEDQTAVSPPPKTS